MLSRIEICVVYSYFTFRVSLTLLLRACESARIIQTQAHNVLLMNKLIPAVQHSIMWDGEHVHDSKLSKHTNSEQKEGEPSMATKVENTIVINRPVETVYTYLADVRNNLKWQVGILETRVETDGPATVGTKVTDVRTFIGRKIEITYEIVEMVPNKLLSLKSISGPFPFKGTTTLESLDGGTRVTTAFEMEATGFFKLAEGLVTSGLKKDLESSFAKLKEILEAQG